MPIFLIILIVLIFVWIIVLGIRDGVRKAKEEQKAKEQKRLQKFVQSADHNRSTTKFANMPENASLVRHSTIDTPLGSVSFSASTSARYVEIKQKTPGALEPFSIDAWHGYISPSGGFINFARYQVVGINPATNRKNRRIYEAMSEANAIAQAKLAGFIGPFEVFVLPSELPTERQLNYAADLGATIPDGACRLDVSAIISRITDEDETPADENLAEWAHIYGVKFSRYHGRKAIMELACSLSRDDYEDFISSIDNIR